MINSSFYLVFNYWTILLCQSLLLLTNLTTEKIPLLNIIDYKELLDYDRCNEIRNPRR